MTLDDAIIHAREVAEKNYEMQMAYHDDYGVYSKEESRCRECAEEHEQLAEWLEELKYTRKLLDDYGAKSIDEVYRMGIKKGKQEKVKEVTEHIAMLVTADMVSVWAFDNIKILMSEVEE